MYIAVVSLHSHVIGAVDFNLLLLCPNLRILSLSNSVCDIEQFGFW